jgi:hypothetical protein
MQPHIGKIGMITTKIYVTLPMIIYGPRGKNKEYKTLYYMRHTDHLKNYIGEKK